MIEKKLEIEYELNKCDVDAKDNSFFFHLGAFCGTPFSWFMSWCRGFSWAVLVNNGFQERHIQRIGRLDRINYKEEVHGFVISTCLKKIEKLALAGISLTQQQKSEFVLNTLSYVQANGLQDQMKNFLRNNQFSGYGVGKGMDTMNKVVSKAASGAVDLGVTIAEGVSKSREKS